MIDVCRSSKPKQQRKAKQYTQNVPAADACVILKLMTGRLQFNSVYMHHHDDDKFDISLQTNPLHGNIEHLKAIYNVLFGTFVHGLIVLLTRNVDERFCRNTFLSVMSSFIVGNIVMVK